MFRKPGTFFHPFSVGEKGQPKFRLKRFQYSCVVKITFYTMLIIILFFVIIQSVT